MPGTLAFVQLMIIHSGNPHLQGSGSYALQAFGWADLEGQDLLYWQPQLQWRQL